MGDSLPGLEAPRAAEKPKKRRTFHQNQIAARSMADMAAPFFVLSPNHNASGRRQHFNVVDGPLSQAPREGWPRYIAKRVGVGVWYVQGQVSGEPNPLRVRVEVVPAMVQALRQEEEEGQARRQNPASPPAEHAELAALRQQLESVQAELEALRDGDEEEELVSRVAARLRAENPAPPPPMDFTKLIPLVQALTATKAPPPPPPIDPAWVAACKHLSAAGYTPEDLVQACAASKLAALDEAAAATVTPS